MHTRIGHWVKCFRLAVGAGRGVGKRKRKHGKLKQFSFNFFLNAFACQARLIGRWHANILTNLRPTWPCGTRGRGRCLCKSCKRYINSSLCECVLCCAFVLSAKCALSRNCCTRAALLLLSLPTPTPTATATETVAYFRPLRVLAFY